MAESSTGSAFQLSFRTPNGYNLGVPQVIDSSSLLSCLIRETAGRGWPQPGRFAFGQKGEADRSVPRRSACATRAAGRLAATCRAESDLPAPWPARRQPNWTRLDLAMRVLKVAGAVDAAALPYFATEGERRDQPQPGEVLCVRHRQYLVGHDTGLNKGIPQQPEKDEYE